MMTKVIPSWVKTGLLPLYDNATRKELPLTTVFDKFFSPVQV